MIIMNQDCSRCNQPLDLAPTFPVDSGRYTVVQHIDNGHASYTVTDNTTGCILQPDKWHNRYTLYDTTGHAIYISVKELVRKIYDSEWCIDQIPDLPGEIWYFIDSHWLAGIPESRETYLISIYGRAKHYTDNYAALFTPCPNPTTEYDVISINRYGHRLSVSIHRLVGYYFVWQRDRPELPFDKLHIHHVLDKRHNQAWYLLALTPAEHRALHAALAKDTTGVQKSA